MFWLVVYGLFFRVVVIVRFLPVIPGKDVEQWMSMSFLGGAFVWKEISLWFVVKKKCAFA